MQLMGRKRQLYLIALFVFIFVQSVTVTVAGTARDTLEQSGDIDLDGVCGSIADYVTFQGYFVCGIVFLPEPIEESIAQTDLNCDGLTLTLADFFYLWRRLLGQVEPCYWTGDALGPESPTIPADRAAIEPYGVEIVDQGVAINDVGWVDLVVTGGSEPFQAFQFHLQYDPDGISFLGAEFGDQFDHWLLLAAYDTVVNGTTNLRIAGVLENPPDTTVGSPALPPLPATLVRLTFQLTHSDTAFVKDIRFAWTDCGENGLVVSDSVRWCQFTPEYLAVSRNVFDADGNDITGTDPVFGGVDDSCLMGGLASQPERLVDLTSGRLTYTPCCQGIRGNFDGDAADQINVADLSFLVQWLFLGDLTPICEAEVDVNEDGEANVADLSFLVEYLFLGGPEPPPCP